MAEAHGKQHDYHLVDPSPWPLAASVFAFVMAVGAIVWMRSVGGGGGMLGMKGPWLFAIGFAGVAVTAALWWRDIIQEAHRGDHTPVVQLHLRYGMILFIASEVMFFVAWFWAYFDAALFPAGVHPIANTDEIVGLVQRNEVTGGHWPPKPSETFRSTFDPWGCRSSIR